MIPGVQDHAESRGRDVSVQPRFDLPVRIAVSLNTNGFGDTIISLAWLKALCRQTPEQILFDLYGRMNNLAFLTQGCSFVDGIYPPDLYPNASGYDAKIILLHHAVIDAISAHSLGSKSATLFETIRRIQEFNASYDKYIKNRPHFNGAWFSLCMMQGWDRWTSLWANQGVSFSNDVNFAAPLSADDLSIVGRYGLKDRGYIILHRGTDNARSESDRLSSTKVWPRKNAEAFCTLFRKKYPGVLIVQVGTDALMRVGGVDLDLVGKTSMGETAVLLKHSLLLLDGDSGLVHLNHALSGKSVVLFGPTPSAFFGYAENANITSQFCTGCVWMRGTRWHTECLRGFDGPKCLEEITPSTVLEAATAILSGRPSFSYTLAESVVIDGADPVKGLESVLRRHLAGTDKTRCRIAVTGDHDLRAASFLAEQGHTVTSFLEPFGAEKNDHGALSHASVRQAAQCGFSLDFASGLALPLQDNHADFVVCRDVGRDVYYSSYVLKELLRVLQPGGSLIAMAASRASASDERCSSECMEFSRDLMKECAVNMPEHSMAKMACGETVSGIVCVITKGVGVHMSAAKPSAFQAGGTV